MEDNEEDEDDDNYPMFPEYGDTAMGEAEDEETLDEPADDLRRAIVDAQRECKSENEKLKLERMLEDHKKGCTQIVKKATKNLVAHWNCCNGRQRMVYLKRDLRIY